MGKKPKGLGRGVGGNERETEAEQGVPQYPKPEDIHAPSHNLNPLPLLGLSLFSFKGGGSWSPAQALPCWTKLQQPGPEDKGGLLGRQGGAMCLLQCLNGLLSLPHVELSDPHSYVQGWTSEGMGVCNGHQGQ